MAAAPFRPPWFGNRGVQVLAAGALAYSLVQVVVQLLDAAWGEAFLYSAGSVRLGSVLAESLRFRRGQDAAPEEPADRGD